MSSLGMEISCDQFHECCLSSSTRSDESGLLSSQDSEREIIEYFGIVISIGNILDENIFLLWREGRSGVVSCDGSECIERLPHLLDMLSITGEPAKSIIDSAESRLQDRDDQDIRREYEKTLCSL